MDWIARLSAAVEYVEKRLDGEVTAQDACSAANMSAFQFQRTFTVVAGVPFAEYVRRRRLTLAARDIAGGEGILDVAVKYGWESQASFTRSFKALHGITPGAVREAGAVVKAYPPLSFKLTIQGANSMDYEIREIGAFVVAGEQRTFDMREGMNFEEIPAFWGEKAGDGSFERMMRLADAGGVLGGCGLGACFDFSEDQAEFSYLIGMEPKAGADTDGLTVREVPARTWAVFKGSDPLPRGIQELAKRIFAEWFPATEYEHAGEIELEVYGRKPGGECGTTYEIWVPVKKA